MASSLASQVRLAAQWLARHMHGACSCNQDPPSAKPIPGSPKQHCVAATQKPTQHKLHTKCQAGPPVTRKVSVSVSVSSSAPAPAPPCPSSCPTASRWTQSAACRTCLQAGQMGVQCECPVANQHHGGGSYLAGRRLSCLAGGSSAARLHALCSHRCPAPAGIATHKCAFTTCTHRCPR